MSWFQRDSKRTLRYNKQPHNNQEARECGGRDNEGGKGFTYINSIHQFVFADTSKFLNFGSLSAARFIGAAAASQKKGSNFIVFGGQDSLNAAVDIIDVQSFASNATAVDSANLSEPLARNGAFGSKTHCFRIGGVDAAFAVRLDDIGKVDADNVANETLLTTLANPNQFLGGCNTELAGYSCGGNVGFVDVSSLQRFDFHTEVNNATWNSMTFSFRANAVGSNENRIIVAGGTQGITTYVTRILYHDVKDDASGATFGDLSLPRQSWPGSSSQHTMFMHRGSADASANGERTDVFRLEIDTLDSASLFVNYTGTAQANFTMAYGGSA
jgi:hypothetical protein